MIWKMHKNRKIRSLCLGLFLFACCSFFGCLFSSRVWATNITSANITRSYYHPGVGRPTLNENVGSQNIPYTALTVDWNTYKLLYQVTGSTVVGDTDFSTKYKTLTVTGVFKQRAYNSNSNPIGSPNVQLDITTHRQGQNSVVTHVISCDTTHVVEDNSIIPQTYYYAVSCGYQYSDYSVIDAFSLIVGTDTNDIYNHITGYYDWVYVGNYDQVYPGALGYNESFIFNEFSYNLQKTDDPVVAGQTELINLNTDILQQIMNNNQQDLQDRQGLTDLNNQNNVDASNAGDAATQANTPLFSAITTIYGYLLYPSPSNCVIGPVSIYDMNLGNLDFCTGFDIPQPLIAIGGLAMIGLVLALCFAVLHSAISLYREFLGGGK